MPGEDPDEPDPARQRSTYEPLGGYGW